NVVVAHAVQVEAALVDAAGNHGAVAHRHHGDTLAGGGGGVLNADVPVGAVGLGADGQHVAAEVEHAAGDAPIHQEILDAVGDVPLGNGAKVNGLPRGE